MTQRDRDNWIASLASQVDFYLRTWSVRRKDPEFEWKAFERKLEDRHPALSRLVRRTRYAVGTGPRPAMTLEWLHENGGLLWETRRMLGDDLSRLMFDSALVVRMTGHRKFYFPRIDFDDLIGIGPSQPFSEPGFPHDYLGVPLRVFDATILGRPSNPPLKVITREIQLRLVNSYRQYLIRREGFDISPRDGDVVLDCGACIGEVSLLFAGLVGTTGSVHLFDPMQLHARFCQLQADWNPAYAGVVHVNALAVGDSTHDATVPQVANDRISPAAISTDDFACTTIDDYARSGLQRIDFIKMDIEGAEMAALAGAADAIREFKPRLAISGYHKPQDLWEIPQRIRDLNPGYRLAFGHHTPIKWESVFYAFTPGDRPD